MGWKVGRQRLVSLGWLLHLAGGALALTVLGSGWLAHVGLERQRQSLENTLANSRLLVARADVIRHRHDLALQAARAAQQRLDRLRGCLPAQADEAEFLRQLADLSTDTGLALDQFRPQRVADHPPHKRLELQISGRGSYAAVCRFLAGLEQLPRLAHVRSLSIGGPASAEELCTLVVELDLFFSPGGVASAAAEVRS